MGVKYIDMYCNNDLSLIKDNANANTIVTGIQDIEKKFTGYPSQFMCTDVCPCTPGTWYEKYTSLDRVAAYDGKTVDAWARSKFKRTVLAVSASKDINPFKLAASPTDKNSFNNFWDCYLKVQALEAIAAQQLGSKYQS